MTEPMKIPEFLAKVRSIAGSVGLVNSVKRFVCFFDEVLRQRSVSLLAVPRTSARCAEAGHN